MCKFPFCHAAMAGGFRFLWGAGGMYVSTVVPNRGQSIGCFGGVSKFFGLVTLCFADLPAWPPTLLSWVNFVEVNFGEIAVVVMKSGGEVLERWK